MDNYPLSLKRNPTPEEVIAVCEPCGTKGFIMALVDSKCPVCKGTQKPFIPCSICNATGIYPKTKESCRICLGDGSYKSRCKNCGGDGCEQCEDTGRHAPNCRHCRGTGTVKERIEETCTVCEGTGADFTKLGYPTKRTTEEKIADFIEIQKSILE